MKAVSMVVALVVAVVMVTGPLGGGGGVAEAVSCEPDCIGKDLGVQVINPRNCSEYYYCLGDGTATNHPVACPADNIFSEADGKCIPGDPTACENPCLGSSGCHLTCNSTLGFVSDINNCSRYYICNPSGALGPINCDEDNPYFNGKSCGKDESACCESVCGPYCDASSKAYLIPDPTDCKMYYICTGEEEIPGEDKHYNCRDNTTFNVQTGVCSSTAECTLLCKEPIGSSTTSTTTTTTTTTTTKPGTADGGSTSTSTSTLSSVPPSGCADSLTCTSIGFFPVCTDCQPEYFSCETVGEQATIGRCTGGLVFNPVPEYPMCILLSNCPYSPGKKT